MEDTERKGFNNPQNNNDQDDKLDNEQEEQFLRRRMAYLERMRRSHQGRRDVPPYNEMPPVPPVPPMYGTMPPKKSKFVASLLSFIFPGVGHFYLGLMQRGLIIIMLLALDIVAIVYFSAVDAKVNVPLIVLLALMLPVIYFFNLFDALQSAERVNHQAMYGTTEHVRQGPWLGLLLLFGGFIMLLFTVDPVWLRWFFTYAGSYAGAAVLIGGGIFLLVKESRKRR